MSALMTLILPLADAVPEDDDVVAGGWGALVFVGLIVATALLCWSFVRQMRKTQRAKDAGVFGDEPKAEQEAAAEAAAGDDAPGEAAPAGAVAEEKSISDG